MALNHAQKTYSCKVFENLTEINGSRYIIFSGKNGRFVSLCCDVTEHKQDLISFIFLKECSYYDTVGEMSSKGYMVRFECRLIKQYRLKFVLVIKNIYMQPANLIRYALKQHKPMIKQWFLKLLR